MPPHRQDGREHERGPQSCVYLRVVSPGGSPVEPGCTLHCITFGNVRQDDMPASEPYVIVLLSAAIVVAYAGVKRFSRRVLPNTVASVQGSASTNRAISSGEM